MSLPLSIQFDFSLRTLNTFGVEARAHAYLQVDHADVLAAVRNDPDLCALPRLVLGGGSNILLTADFAGLVLHMRSTGIAIIGEDADAVHVRAAAGENWHGLVLWTLAQGLAGLENLSLIPGSVGASPIQNIGAYGLEVEERILSLRIFDFATGKIVEMARSAADRAAVPPNNVSSTCSCPASAGRIAAAGVGSSAKSGGTTSGAARPAVDAGASLPPNILSMDAQPDNKVRLVTATRTPDFIFICLSNCWPD